MYDPNLIFDLLCNVKIFCHKSLLVFKLSIRIGFEYTRKSGYCYWGVSNHQILAITPSFNYAAICEICAGFEFE